MGFSRLRNNYLPIDDDNNSKRLLLLIWRNPIEIVSHLGSSCHKFNQNSWFVICSWIWYMKYIYMKVDKYLSWTKTGGVVEKVLGLLQKIKTKTTPNSFFVPLVNISVYSVRRQYFVITSTPTFLVVQVVLFN